MSFTFEGLKDPDAQVDYSINWATWLDSDTISTSTWSVTGPSSPSDLVIESDSNSTTATTVVLSGGTANRDYFVTNTIVTAGSLTDERTILIRVRNR